jgi:lysophospholipase L1-like esterase
MREKRAETPILLVEAYYYVNGFTKPAESDNHLKNTELKKAFDTLKRSGINNLYYRKGDDLIGDDYEATVDGVHPNDLGMYRIARALEPTIKKYLK